LCGHLSGELEKKENRALIYRVFEPSPYLRALDQPLKSQGEEQRNQPWLNQALPENGPLIRRAPDLALSTLLTMDNKHYVNKVWPMAFYISRQKVAKWKMNTARALGTQRDPQNVPLLVLSLNESPHEMVRGMCAWSLGRLGGARVKAALEGRRSQEKGLVRMEIEQALEMN
jgi:HEAT repeat protein